MRFRWVFRVQVAHRVLKQVGKDLEHALEICAFWIPDMDEFEQVSERPYLYVVKPSSMQTYDQSS